MASMVNDNAKIIFHLEGDPYRQAVIDFILAAEHSISIHVYIFKLDLFGLAVAEALMAKSNAGVRVNLTVDFIGSFKQLKPLRSYFFGHENISFNVFNPLTVKGFFHIGRRLHHKVIISDQSNIIIGGINICNDESTPFKRPRLDFAVEVSGSDFKYVSHYFDELSLNYKDALLADRAENSFHIISSNWFYNVCDIYDSYIENIIQSKKSILLIHGYFFPSKKILDLLVQKASEGVNVEVLIPKYSDWERWNFAVQHLCKFLGSKNINVYEWPLSNLHGKLGLFDEKVISLGSHNLNYMSRFANLELNVVLTDAELVQSIYKQTLEPIINDSKKLSFKGSQVEFIRNTFSYWLVIVCSILSVKFIWLIRLIRR